MTTDKALMKQFMKEMLLFVREMRADLSAKRKEAVKRKKEIAAQHKKWEKQQAAHAKKMAKLRKAGKLPPQTGPNDWITLPPAVQTGGF